jgi:hypothetical protein
MVLVDRFETRPSIGFANAAAVLFLQRSGQQLDFDTAMEELFEKKAEAGSRPRYFRLLLITVGLQSSGIINSVPTLL